jgi:uncharacterized membrane protein YcjF (UPF0283 family)
MQGRYSGGDGGTYGGMPYGVNQYQQAQAQQQQQQQQQQQAQMQQLQEQFQQAQAPGYLETLWQRRRDMAKLLILAIVVLLAMSMHTAMWHYLRNYIESAQRLTFWQELGLRAGYPVAIFLVLWHAKSFLPSPTQAQA